MADEFVLRPPVGWLNRVDDLLVHHRVTDHHGSPVGQALGNLIRSWAGEEDGHGPEHWGPRGVEPIPSDPSELARDLAEATANLDKLIHAQADGLAERRLAAVEHRHQIEVEDAAKAAEIAEQRTQDLIAEFRRQIAGMERQREAAQVALATIAIAARDGHLTLAEVHLNASRSAGPRAMREHEKRTTGSTLAGGAE